MGSLDALLIAWGLNPAIVYLVLVLLVLLALQRAALWMWCRDNPRKWERWNW